MLPRNLVQRKMGTCSKAGAPTHLLVGDDFPNAAISTTGKQPQHMLRCCFVKPSTVTGDISPTINKIKLFAGYISWNLCNIQVD